MTNILQVITNTAAVATNSMVLSNSTQTIGSFTAINYISLGATTNATHAGDSSKWSLVVDLLKSYSLPVTLLIIVFGFKSQLGKVLDRLSSFKFRGVEAAFTRELKAAEDEAKLEQPSTATGTGFSRDIEEYLDIARIAQVSPRAAITEAWRLVERATIAAVKSQDLQFEATRGIIQPFQELKRRKLVTSKDADLFDRLRKLRNEAAHAQVFQIKTDEAQRYLELALTLADRLQSITEKPTIP